MADDEGERHWDAGWSGRKHAQLLRMSRLSIDEKLAWLEEARRLACEIQAVREKAPDER